LRLNKIGFITGITGRIQDLGDPPQAHSEDNHDASHRPVNNTMLESFDSPLPIQNKKKKRGLTLKHFVKIKLQRLCCSGKKRNRNNLNSTQVMAEDFYSNGLEKVETSFDVLQLIQKI
jgi:hypothetical protein